MNALSIQYRSVIVPILNYSSAATKSSLPWELNQGLGLRRFRDLGFLQPRPGTRARYTWGSDCKIIVTFANCATCYVYIDFNQHM